MLIDALCVCVFLVVGRRSKKNRHMLIDALCVCVWSLFGGRRKNRRVVLVSFLGQFVFDLRGIICGSRPVAASQDAEAVARSWPSLFFLFVCCPLGVALSGITPRGSKKGGGIFDLRGIICGSRPFQWLRQNPRQREGRRERQKSEESDGFEA